MLDPNKYRDRRSGRFLYKEPRLCGIHAPFRVSQFHFSEMNLHLNFSQILFGCIPLFNDIYYNINIHHPETEQLRIIT